MTKHLVCVEATLPVAALAALFLDRGISGAPVVDASEKILGIVSKTDLVRVVREADTRRQVPPSQRQAPVWEEADGPIPPRLSLEKVGGRAVRDIMTPIVHVMLETESVARAAAVMARLHVHRLPIVAPTGKLVGMLSSLDILRFVGRVKEGS